MAGSGRHRVCRAAEVNDEDGPTGTTDSRGGAVSSLVFPVEAGCRRLRALTVAKLNAQIFAPDAGKGPLLDKRTTKPQDSSFKDDKTKLVLQLAQIDQNHRRNSFHVRLRRDRDSRL